MPATHLRITGSTNHSGDMAQLVLADRLSGHDTFLTGTLQLDQRSIRVRILRLDDVTVLRPVDPSEVVGITPTWTGVLHLSHGARYPEVPTDLAAEAARQGRTLDLLDDAELRYALTFLKEATTTHIRQRRIAAIVAALSSTREIASGGLGHPLSCEKETPA